MNRDKARAGIYSMAAFYMLYTAMQLHGEGNLPAMIFFIIAAMGLIVFAIVIAVRVTKEERKGQGKSDDESETT